MAYSSKALQQLGHPSGLVGRLVLWRLNRVNRGMNATALAALDLRGGEEVLDIGFGGGALVAQVLDDGKAARAVGTDVSALAVATAKKRFRRAIADGRAAFEQCSDSRLPFPDASFSHACGVNVIYFWSDGPAMLAEIRRVLRPGGRLVLCYAEGAPDRVTKFPSESVESALRETGFVAPATTQGSDRENGRYHCTVAEKAPLP